MCPVTVQGFSVTRNPDHPRENFLFENQNLGADTWTCNLSSVVVVAECPTLTLGIFLPFVQCHEKNICVLFHFFECLFC